jgi:hypothetical protein
MVYKFEKDYQPMGLFGTTTKSGVNALGFVAWNQTCEKIMFSDPEPTPS